MSRTLIFLQPAARLARSLKVRRQYLTSRWCSWWQEEERTEKSWGRSLRWWMLSFLSWLQRLQYEEYIEWREKFTEDSLAHFNFDYWCSRYPVMYVMIEFPSLETERSLQTTHFTLHTSRYTLHTIHFTLHATHYTLHTTHYRVTCLNRVLTVSVPASSPTSLTSVQREGSLVRSSNFLQTSPAWHNSRLVSSLNTFSHISPGRELITTSAGIGSGSSSGFVSDEEDSDSGSSSEHWRLVIGILAVSDSGNEENPWIGLWYYNGKNQAQKRVV